MTAAGIRRPACGRIAESTAFGGSVSAMRPRAFRPKSDWRGALLAALLAAACSTSNAQVSANDELDACMREAAISGAVTGGGIGGTIGALLGDRARDRLNKALGGAAVGAAVGAIAATFSANSIAGAQVTRRGANGRSSICRRIPSLSRA